MRRYPALHWLRAFAEAAMVGGLADWFAVTALFRHPLGLPIPHTAIIPENKDRIAGAMAGFLRANFLTPQVVARRLAGLDVAGALGGFLAILPPAAPAAARHRRADGRHAAIAARRATGQLLKGTLRGRWNGWMWRPAGAIAGSQHRRWPPPPRDRGNAALDRRGAGGE
jgi:hypothetical protein